MSSLSSPASTRASTRSAWWRACWAMICLLAVPSQVVRRRTWLACKTLALVASAIGVWAQSPAFSGDEVGAHLFWPYLVLCSLLATWLTTALACAIRLNRPELAGLAPLMRARLLAACAFLTVVAIALATVALSLNVGHAGLVLAAAGLLTAALVLSFRDSAVVVVSTLVFLFGMFTGFTGGEQLPPLVARLDQPVVVAVALALAVLALRFALLRVLPRGGDGHWAWHRRMQAHAFAGSRRPWFWRLDQLRMVRRSSTPAAPPRSVARAMLAALGPRVQMSPYLGFVVLVAIGVALLPAARRYGVIYQGVMVLGGLAQLLFFCMPPLFAWQARVALVQRDGEQALYRLAPGAPGVTALNRLLAGALLRRFLLIWLAALVCALALMRSVWPGIDNYLVAPLLAAATLPFAAVVLTDVAALRPSSSKVGMFAASVGLPFSSAFVLSVVGKSHDFPWLWLAGAIAVASLVWLRWRWLRMMTMAPAFPAGRMAS